MKDIVTVTLKDKGRGPFPVSQISALLKKPDGKTFIAYKVVVSKNGKKCKLFGINVKESFDDILKKIVEASN